jgi:cytochrome oxidase Cu insertion factor (SCO1/SenC/PrrC family)
VNDRVAQLRARNLRTLGMLAALFLLPLLLAFLFYYGSSWRPARLVNHGALITPARALPAVRLRRISVAAAPDTPFRGKWSLVYVADGACEEACRRTLYLMRQTRLALNNDMTRVERVLLARDECDGCADLVRDNPGLTVLAAGGPEATALIGQFPGPLREQSLVVVDPLGNLMMSYDGRQDPHGLLEDLKKLLRLSHIG